MLGRLARYLDVARLALRLPARQILIDLRGRGERRQNIAAAPAVAQVHGSPLLALGMLGFLIWTVFIAVASVRLPRIGLMERDTPEGERLAPR
ncbi:MAG TPA: hypothetical protein VF201_11455 [Nitrolancea sp.]